MTDFTTNEVEYTPDMGGKEGLSALGWSRIEHRGRNREPYELWQHINGHARLAITTTDMCCYEAGMFDDRPEWVTGDTARAALVRMDELKAGDVE